MDFQFTFKEILLASVLAFIVTAIMINIWERHAASRKRSALSDYRARDIGKILKRCYRLFPTDIIQFKGMTFHRGMKVHVTTSQMKDFEGQLIGLSKENMICILTNKYIIAHELNKIRDIYLCPDEKPLKV